MTELVVTMNDRTKISAEVENYDPKALAAELNDNSKNYVDIGDIVVQRYSVTRIVPSDKKELEEV